MSIKCSPGYWFLGRTDKPQFILRQTGSAQKFTKNVLLPARITAWKWLVDDASLDEPFTSDNLVTPLVDGEDYMKELDKDLRSLGKDDFVLLAGWAFTMTQSLKYDNKANSRLRDLLRALRILNAEVRLLAWDNTIPMPKVDNKELVDFVNNEFSVGDRRAYLDKNRDGFGLAHHQKAVVIGKQAFTDCSAYVGGIDLAADRWDNKHHNKTVKESTFIGWHDIQVKVKGDAVMQLWANFAERWIDNNFRLSEKRESFKLESCPRPKWNKTKPGNHHVQVLRTVAPVRRSFARRSMPWGQRTVLCALQKAISQAECYIYIEEQFLWDCELADFIGERMKQEPELKLIVVMAAATELPLHLGEYHYHLRSKFFMKVMGKARKEDIAFGNSTRVYAYGLYQESGEPVYVHSKLMIIDDRYVAVGSANFDSRSMFVDTELTVGIVDGDIIDSILDDEQAKVCKFARDLREQLWAEHLGLDPTRLKSHDPIHLLQLFPRASKPEYGLSLVWPRDQAEARRLRIHHIRCYVNVPGRNWLTNATQHLLDRDKRHL